MLTAVSDTIRAMAATAQLAAAVTRQPSRG
jgi:hypothetical protein